MTWEKKIGKEADRNFKCIKGTAFSKKSTQDPLGVSCLGNIPTRSKPTTPPTLWLVLCTCFHVFERERRENSGRLEVYSDNRPGCGDKVETTKKL